MKKLYRSKTDKKVLGVCGGLGEYFNVDPTLFRFLFVAAFFGLIAFPATITYLVAWLLIPEQP